MQPIHQINYDPWPALPYDDFSETAHMLHMLAQMIGKIKLATPFEPHWANVVLWPTAQGFTTGPIPYQRAAFSLEIDLIEHLIICSSSWGQYEHCHITSTSVAELCKNLFAILKSMGIDIKINMMPQEIPNPIPFDQNTDLRQYNVSLANAWFRIMISTYNVMQRYHSRFKGISPAVGLMWGTFDLRDARYLNISVPTTGLNADYIRRNAMDVAQIEAGFWHGNPEYKKPAYFSFTYPQPQSINKANIQPKAAHWNDKLSEFILDYDNVRMSSQPEQDLLDFFESTYNVGAKYAHWDPTLIGEGKPV